MSNPIKPELFTFFEELGSHNDRDWFAGQKERFRSDVVEPAFEFVERVGESLPEVSPHFEAIPSLTRGSLFRIYRDTRFSRDKTPYKPYQGIRFPHEAGNGMHTPGFYLHLDPSGCFVGVGSWHPAREGLQAYRQAIVDDPDAWAAVRHDRVFAERFELQGDSLKRPPRGFPVDHPWVEDLKRKDFIGVAALSRDEVLANDFVDRFVTRCREGAPLVAFLCRAVGAPF